MPQSENRPPLVIRHVDVGALVRAVEQPDFPRPLGATPLYPPLALIPDEPQDMGDALALDRAITDAAPQSYVFRWHWYQGGAA
jgi:hypothetical protein